MSFFENNLLTEVKKMQFPYRIEKADSDCWIVCVHGFSESGECWDNIFDKLHGKANLVSYDCLGHGKNKKLWPQVTFKSYVDQLGVIVSNLKKQNAKRKIVLVGHSQAAAIVAQFALSNVKLVDGLMLISPFLEIKEPLKALWSHFIEFVKEGKRKEMWSINSALLLGPKSKVWSDFRKKAIQHRLDFFQQDHLVVLLQALLSIKITGDLAKLSHLPMHIVHGQRDTMFPTYYSEDILKVLPNAKYVEIKDAVHLLVELEPEVIKSLGELIQSVEKLENKQMQENSFKK